MKIKLFLLTICCLLTACGFHLRGTIAVPEVSSMTIILQSGSLDLVTFLTTQLENFGIKAGRNIKTQYSLIIENDNIFQQINNVSASTSPRQYLVHYTVHFSFINNKSAKTLLSNSAVHTIKQITINNNRILSADIAEGTDLKEMRMEAAIQIINKINQVLKDQQTTNKY